MIDLVGNLLKTSCSKLIVLSLFITVSITIDSKTVKYTDLPKITIREISKDERSKMTPNDINDYNSEIESNKTKLNNDSEKISKLITSHFKELGNVNTENYDQRLKPSIQKYESRNTEVKRDIESIVSKIDQSKALYKDPIISQEKKIENEKKIEYENSKKIIEQEFMNINQILDQQKNDSIQKLEVLAQNKLEKLRNIIDAKIRDLGISDLTRNLNSQQLEAQKKEIENIKKYQEDIINLIREKIKKSIELRNESSKKILESRKGFSMESLNKINDGNQNSNKNYAENGRRHIEDFGNLSQKSASDKGSNFQIINEKKIESIKSMVEDDKNKKTKIIEDLEKSRKEVLEIERKQLENKLEAMRIK